MCFVLLSDNHPCVYKNPGLVDELSASLKRHLKLDQHTAPSSKNGKEDKPLRCLADNTSETGSVAASGGPRGLAA